MGLFDRILHNWSNRRSPDGTMTFVDHLEELRWHILRSLVAVVVGGIIAFINIEFIFNDIILGPTQPEFISNKLLCILGEKLDIEMLCMEANKVRFQNTSVTGQFMLSFSSAATLGFILAFPYILWEFWRFLKPGLKEKEIKGAKGLVFWGSVLFLIGVLFAYFVVAPFTISFFAQYILSDQFENIYMISDYYETLSSLVLGIGIIFELPLIIYFLSKIGIMSPKFLREKRRYAIIILLVISAVITPPDWFTIFLVFFPLYFLYEVSITISARVSKEKEGLVKKDLDW